MFSYESGVKGAYSYNLSNYRYKTYLAIKKMSRIGMKNNLGSSQNNEKSLPKSKAGLRSIMEHRKLAF